jgi:hypothetical protein
MRTWILGGNNIMSLDVYLTLPGVQVQIQEPRIFIREGGQNKEITRAEWDARYPDREPFTVASEDSETVYSGNITHNLNKMAAEAGIHEALWRPEEIGITHARQLIEPLKTGLALLKSDPARFKALNPSNGWGTYEGLRQFVADYLVACKEYPSAEVSVSR